MSRRKGNSSSEEELYENEKQAKGLRKRQQVKYYESSSSEDDYEENIIKKPKRTKKSGSKSTSSSYTDDPSFESGDSDFETYQKKGKGSSVKKEKEPLSEYEKQLLENKVKNQEFLKSIGMDQAKDDILELKPKKRKYTKKVESESSNGPKRVSQREKAQINYNEGEIGVVDIESEMGFTGLSFKKLLKFKEEYDDFVEDFSEIILRKKFVQKPVTYDRMVLKWLSQKASMWSVKLTSPSSISWHPSSEHLVLAIGNIGGVVALWAIEDSDYLYKFPVHSKKVTKVQFNPYSTSHLLSSCLDGTLLCCDMQEQKFTEVLRISNCCTCFDFFSPSCYVVSSSIGGVVVVDKRSRGRGGDYYLDKKYTCHDAHINTIHVHPVEKNYFVTAGNDRKVCIWDLRKLSKMPIIEKDYNKNVHSASFSPLSGKYLLTTLLESKFCIYDNEKMTEGILKLHKSVLNGFNGHRFKSEPAWLPNSDDLFTLQNKDKEKKEILHIYDKDLNIYETVTDGVKGNRDHVEFHPFKPAIASLLRQGSIKVCAEEIDA